MTSEFRTVEASDLYDSARRPSPMLEEFFQVLRYRDLIVQLVRRDIVTRYKRSLLGVVWTMLNPLGMMLVLTIVFKQAFGTTWAYAAYLLIGLVAWSFFAQTTMSAMRQLVWGGALIQRIYLPKSIFAISAMGTGLVNLLLSLIPLATVMFCTGVHIRFSALFLPVAILLLLAFALGIALLLSTVAAYFPDVAEMYEIALMAWMYLTPIIYPEEIVPEPIRWWIFNLNPMYYLVKLFRLPLYEGVWPGFENLVLGTTVSMVVLALGWWAFTRKADELVYRV